MAEAMASATRAGRLAYLAGRMGKKFTAEPSSSNEGKLIERSKGRKPVITVLTKK